VPDAKAVAGESTKEEEFSYLQTWEGVRIGAALQMIATPNPVAALLIRRIAADCPLLWPDWELPIDAPLPLSRELLGLLKDGTAVPNLRGKDPREWTAEERAYQRVVSEALINSKLVSPELFEKEGQKYRYVTFDHLWRDPEEYRGKVVPVTGRMIRLRRQQAPRPAQAYGLPFAYEAQVVGPTAKRNPYWILFVTLPEGLEEAESMNRAIRFYGYYIKKVKYESDDQKVRVTHLLIGPTVILEEPATTAPPERIFSRDVLLALMGGALAIVLAIVGMALYFRRGDRAVQSKLAALRDRPLNLGSEEPEPPKDSGLGGTP
jgi:hypothetical protein